MPPLARGCLRLLVTQLQLVDAQALETDRQIKLQRVCHDARLQCCRRAFLARPFALDHYDERGPPPGLYLGEPADALLQVEIDGAADRLTARCQPELLQ